MVYSPPASSRRCPADDPKRATAAGRHRRQGRPACRRRVKRHRRRVAEHDANGGAAAHGHAGGPAAFRPNSNRLAARIVTSAQLSRRTRDSSVDRASGGTAQRRRAGRLRAGDVGRLRSRPAAAVLAHRPACPAPARTAMAASGARRRAAGRRGRRQVQTVLGQVSRRPAATTTRRGRTTTANSTIGRHASRRDLPSIARLIVRSAGSARRPARLLVVQREQVVGHRDRAARRTACR